MSIRLATQTLAAVLGSAMLAVCSAGTQVAAPPEDCPVTPYYVNPEPIPENEWRDGFAAGGKWFRSADNQLWSAAQPGYWKAGRPNKGWWLKPWGSRLVVTGKQLDGGGSLTADVPDGYYGDFQASHLFFSSAGCWEVEAQAEDSHLRFVINVGP